MQTTSSRRQVRRVFIITLVLNLAVAAGKIIVGAISGALAITADGFHSLIDGTSNVVALVANRIADQPPDDEHPYGHRRFETLAALLIGAFLILVAWEIATGVIDRLRGEAELSLTPLAFVVLAVTLVVNIGVSTYQIREGKRLNSELLLADAANTSADVFVTLSVLLSMIVVSISGWVWVDLVAAAAVVVLIGRAALRILRQTGSVLVDTAPYAPEYLIELIEAVPSVSGVAHVRSRGPADSVIIDVEVHVPPEMTAGQTEAISQAIRAHLQSHLPGVTEVSVRFTPHDPDERDYAMVVRAAGDALGVSTHEVAVIDTPTGKMLELHAEVPPGQTVQQAHILVSQLETDIRGRLPEIDRVVTHIEPTQQGGEGDYGVSDAESQQIKQDALVILEKYNSAVNWHDLRVYQREIGITLTLHAALSGEMTLEAAHDMTEQAETLLRSQLPALSRVTIHIEPSNGET